MIVKDEIELLGRAREVLAERLPPGWTVEQAGGGEAGERPDALFSFQSTTGMISSGTALVEAKRDFRPVDVERLLGGLTRRLREATHSQPILLVSEYLSPRTREMLASEDINYVDLTGNVRLVMPSPPMFVTTSGVDRRPGRRSGSARTGLSGAKVGRVVRFVTEVTPPYGVTDIEGATGLSRGYVSRILERLADEALIEREPRGLVEDVDWAALLRARGAAVDLFRANTTRTYVAPQGARHLVSALVNSPLRDDMVITGSFAAVELAPIAAPALLVLYLVPAGRAPRLDAAAEALGLLPADEGADVALLWPANEALVSRPRLVDGLSHVNLPQLVVDCLGGIGRMPSEGEAVLEWMQGNKAEWRFPSLEAYLAATAG